MILVKDTDDYLVKDPQFIITAMKDEEVALDSVCYL